MHILCGFVTAEVYFVFILVVFMMHFKVRSYLYVPCSQMKYLQYRILVKQ